MAAGDTDVKICSNALLLLGANEISSFSDGSTQAEFAEPFILKFEIIRWLWPPGPSV